MKSLLIIWHVIFLLTLVFGNNSVTFSYLIYYGSLLQNATDIITKCDSYFITKCDRSLFQNASDFLLQNVTVIINCDNFITKCDSYDKKRCLLQIATVQKISQSLICNTKEITGDIRRIKIQQIKTGKPIEIKETKLKK